MVGTDANSSGGAGSVNEVTQPMMHVWMTGGPMTSGQPALNEVEAARMPVLDPTNRTA